MGGARGGRGAAGKEGAAGKGLRGRGCSAGTAPGGGAEGRGPPTHGRRTGSRCGRARLQASRPAPALTHPAAPRGAPQLRTPSRPTDSSLDPAPSPMPRLGAVFLPVPRLLSILCAPPPKAGAWRGVTIGAAPHAPRCRGARSREDGGALGVGGGSGTGRGDASGGRAAVRRLELGSGRGEERGGGSRAEGSGRRPPHGPPSSSPGCSGTSFVPVPPLFSPPPSPRFQGNPDVWAQLRIAQPCCSARCFLSLHALLPAASASHPCRICIAVPGCCCCCSGGAGGGQEGGSAALFGAVLRPRGAAQGGCRDALCAVWGCSGGAGVQGCCSVGCSGGALGAGMQTAWECNGCRHAGTMGCNGVQWGCIGAGMQAPWGCNGDALVQRLQAPWGAMGMRWCRDAGTTMLPGPAAAAGPPRPPAPLRAPSCSCSAFLAMHGAASMQPPCAALPPPGAPSPQPSRAAHGAGSGGISPGFGAATPLPPQTWRRCWPT